MPTSSAAPSTDLLERSLVESTGGGLRWRIDTAGPVRGRARLSYDESDDGTLTITAMSTHPSAASSDLPRALVERVIALHPRERVWRVRTGGVTRACAAALLEAAAACGLTLLPA